MPRINSTNPRIPDALIITNRNGKIDLGQIEHGDAMYNSVENLKYHVADVEATVANARMKSDPIVETDLSKELSDKLEVASAISDGWEHEGTHYSISDILGMVVDNQEVLTTHTVEHI